MRVMQLTTDLRFGGAERVIVNLVRGLRDRGVECAVAGLFEGGPSPGAMHALLEESGFEVYPVGLERKHMLWRLAGLRAYVNDWRPDLLHCHLFHGHAAGTLLRVLGLGCPMVWTHHSVDRRPLPLRGAFYRLFSRLAGCQVFASEAVRRFQHARAGVAPREELIHNGVDLEPYLALQPRPGAVIGALGRLVPEKGFDVLIRAFARLCAENDEVRLTIAGAGPERAALDRLMRTEGVAGRASLVGFVRDVPGFLAQVNVFAAPSRWEAFGLALLEAMAAGLPCIAARVGGLPEVGGDLVRWVRPDDVDDLYAAMREMAGVRYSREQVARQRARVATRFSREAMTREYLRLYRSLLR